jgi:hypothetical protein
MISVANTFVPLAHIGLAGEAHLAMHMLHYLTVLELYEMQRQ